MEIIIKFDEVQEGFASTWWMTMPILLEPSSLAYSLKMAAGFWGSALAWHFHLPEFLHASVTMTTSLKFK